MANRKFYYFAATQAGDFWELHPGHVFHLDGKVWVCSGFDGDAAVWIARENRVVCIAGSALWDVLSVRNMSPKAREKWNRQSAAQRA